MYKEYQMFSKIVLKESWDKKNRSFRKRLVFRVGVNSGFFSEFNNMILAMAYCYVKKIQFNLSSRGANFSFEKGFEDYFQPFCKEDNSSVHLKYNTRPFGLKAIYPIYKKIAYRIGFSRNALTYNKPPLFIKAMQLFGFIPIMTQDVFFEMRELFIINKTYEFPELSVKGDISELCKVMAKVAWTFNQHSEKVIEELIKSIDLPENYYSLHVRRGDKISEAQIFPIDKYFQKLSDNNILKGNVFISTDDYSIIEMARDRYKTFKIFHLCNIDERGYDQLKFANSSNDFIRTSMLKLFASIEIIKKSELFIGTLSSNIGLFLSLSLENKKALFIDTKKWYFV